jgi:preprotein translocase subunit SecA
MNIGKLLVKVFGSRNDRLLKRYWKIAEQIAAEEPKVRTLSDEQLRARVLELHLGLTGDPATREKPTLKSEDVRAEALAILREAMDRNIGIRKIFDPEENDMNVRFDPDKLSAAARAHYDRVQQTLIAGGMPWQQVPIPVELYDAVRELYPDSRPPFRARPFDVQMIGGIVMYEGRIAEMATGEGKTFVAPLACFMRVLEGYHCHVVTVNDYLVRRDASWIRPAFAALGLSVGYIQSDMGPSGEDRRAQYACDVTYGTNSEFGFDYLRDNMKGSVDQQVQGSLDFAIVDEVDSILIDEARTPLIISGAAARDDGPRYIKADAVARKMIELNKPWAAVEKQVEAAQRAIKAADGDAEKATNKAEKEAAAKRREKAEKDLAEAEAKKEGITQFYEVEWDRKSVHLTHDGIAKAQEIAGVGSFYVGNNVDWPHLMEQAMRAHVVYERDKDYVVERGVGPRSTGQLEVIIIDEYTGRKMVGRQWSDGLHQACEAKEKVPIKEETQTVATITLQNFFKLYRALSGMTGTAQTEAEEFQKIYKLDVVSIPTNRPVIRRDSDDRVYRKEQEKWDAIIEEIKLFSDAGRPVLVGTTSVEKSERLSGMLGRKYGIEHEVLNAKQHEREGHIVALAGQTHVDKHGQRVGNVTIATNMAGRGTDIQLGPEVTWEVVSAPPAGAAEGKYTIKQRGTGETKEVDTTGYSSEEGPEDPLGAVFQLTPTAKMVGGLHVIGTERHTARRIDNQLRGRSGRQGDPGSSRFYVSLEDELMKIFAGPWTIKVLGFLGMEEGMHIEDKRISKGIMNAQKKVEERNFLGRKNLLEYDDVMDYQRTTFYGMRQQVLEGRAVDKVIWGMIGDSIKDAVNKYVTQDFAAATVAEWARVNFEVNLDKEDIAGRRDFDFLEDYVKNQARNQVIEDLESKLGEFLGEDEQDRSGWDTAALSSYAMSRFHVNLSQARIRKTDLEELKDSLREAAFDQIDKQPMDEIRKYLEPTYPHQTLARWAKEKFDVDVDPADFAEPGGRGQSKPAPVLVGLIEGKAREAYARREVEIPVDNLMYIAAREATRIEIPDAAQFVRAIARQKYGVDLAYEELINADVADVRQKLIALQRKALHGGGLEADVDKILEKVDGSAGGDGKEPPPDTIVSRFRERFGIELHPADLYPEPEDERETALDKGKPRVAAMERVDVPQSVRDVLLTRARGVVREELTRLEQFVLIEVLDNKWIDHLYAMDALKSGIGLVGFAEKDPRVAYKKEGFRFFGEMMTSLREMVTDRLFLVRIGGPATEETRSSAYKEAAATHEDTGGYGVAEALQAPATAAPDPEAMQASGGGGDDDGGETAVKVRQIVNEGPKVGRNDPCPCGSGKKYKKCHGQDAA